MKGKPREQTDPSGDVFKDLHEAWISPDVDCQPLEETSVSITNGKVYSTTIKTATSATKDAPLDSPFEIPVGSVEVPPSIFWPAVSQSFNHRQQDAYSRQKAQRLSNGR